jgi:hypothetical protein
MKNKKVHILEFSFYWPLSVEFISARDRGILSLYYLKLFAQSIQRMMVRS